MEQSSKVLFSKLLIIIMVFLGWKIVKKDAVRLSSKSGVKEHSKKWVTTIEGTRFVETYVQVFWDSY